LENNVKKIITFNGQKSIRRNLTLCFFFLLTIEPLEIRLLFEESRKKISLGHLGKSSAQKTLGYKNNT